MREGESRAQRGPALKRTLTTVDPPEHRRDPDPEMESLAEERATADNRPVIGDEMHEAMSRLFATGNLLRRHVVRNALATRELPLGDDQEFPRAEFASSTTGTLLIRVWNHRGERPKPRAATDADRDQWANTFHRFIEACLGRGATFEHPDDDDPR